MSFLEQLKQSRAKIRAAPADPWRLRLERARGKVGYDGVERVSSQSLMDLLEVPQRARTSGACRRLAKIMRELGWRQIKARGLNQRGLLEQIRGWARDKRGSPLS